MTSFPQLMRLARALGQAEIGGDEKAIALAQEEHDAYVDLVRKSDEMSTGLTYGDLLARAPDRPRQ